MNNYIMLPSNNRNREEVITLRMYEHAAGYGIYIMILEQMREAKDYRISANPARVAFAINEPDVELVKRVINDYQLFDINDDNTITSRWLIDTMSSYEEKKNKRQEAAAAAAAARWHKTNNDNTTQCDSNADASKTQCEKMPNQYINKEINKINQYTEYNANAATGVMCDEFFFVNIKKELWDTIEDICKDNGISYDDKYKTEYIINKTEEHNTNLCADIAKKHNLTALQYRLLVSLTDNGMIGHPATVAIIKSCKDIEAGNIQPKYMMNYLISKINGYKEAKEQYSRRQA